LLLCHGLDDRDSGRPCALVAAGTLQQLGLVQGRVSS
jgi:hypothetical protein